ncbi:UAP56-interacting factor isoform X4 [Callithrix jacchus]
MSRPVLQGPLGASQGAGPLCPAASLSGTAPPAAAGGGRGRGRRVRAPAVRLAACASGRWRACDSGLPAPAPGATSPAMNRFGTRLVGATATSSPPPKARSNENLDKIDMSLGEGPSGTELECGEGAGGTQRRGLWGQGWLAAVAGGVFSRVGGPERRAGSAGSTPGAGLDAGDSGVLSAAAVGGGAVGAAPGRRGPEDDIIKLNRKEGKKQNFPRLNRRLLQQSGARQFRMRVRWGIQQNSGFGKTSLNRRGRVMPGKRRPNGVITGLAARKTTGIRKGISPMNRPPLSDKNIERYFPVLKRKANLLRQNEGQRKPVAVLKRPNQLNRKNSIPANFTRSGNKLNHQKDTRQATFLFRRGLKVQAQLNTEQLLDDVVAKRTRQWRTSTTNGGILTVSIDNPGAVQCPVTPKPRLTRTAVPSFLSKREQNDVKKVPKGVPLQFDINSVGKQTGMTLNERFGILKEQRATLTYNKGGSRFVTVG